MGIDNTGGPMSSQEFVTVKPVGSDSDWHVTRWFYFDEQSEYYERNFAEKVCTDEEYRQACIDRSADWAVIADTFEPIERQLYNLYRDNDSFTRDETEEMIKEAFKYIKNKVRNEDNTDICHDDVLDNISTTIVLNNL